MGPLSIDCSSRKENVPKVSAVWTGGTEGGREMHRTRERERERQHCSTPNLLQCGLCDIMHSAQQIVENNPKFTGSHIQQ